MFVLPSRSGPNIFSSSGADGDDHAGRIDLCLRQYDSVHIFPAGTGSGSRPGTF